MDLDKLMLEFIRKNETRKTSTENTEEEEQ